MTPSARGRDLENRTVAHLTRLGYRAERVARTGRHTGGDVLGVVDVLSVHPEHGPELHQVTTQNNASGRRKKIRDANLHWPVRLWKWRKEKNRWIFSSEEVFPLDRSETEDKISGPAGADNTRLGLTETA